MSARSNNRLRTLTCLLLSAAALFLSGCAGNPATTSNTGSTDTAVQVAANDLQPDFQQALIQMQAEQWHAARDTLQHITEQNPTLSGPWVNLGIARTKLGDQPGAESAFKRALDTNSRNVEAYNQLGMLYRRTGRFDQARSIYDEALRVEADNATVHWNLAILYDRYLEDPRKSLQHYEQYQQLTGSTDAQLVTWIAALQQQVYGERMTAKVKP